LNLAAFCLIAPFRSSHDSELRRRRLADQPTHWAGYSFEHSQQTYLLP
jgi:hypothetical protein